MREIMIDGEKLRIRATPICLVDYQKEFNADLLGDLMKMREVAEDPTKIDTVSFLQLIWVMAKADSLAFGKPFPSFYEWVGSLESIDFTDQKTMGDVIEEANNGFFRSTKNKGGGK